MSVPTIVTLSYTGSILSDLITTSPWGSVTAVYPEYGYVPYSAQFVLDILQPRNLDGARYRIGGAQYPVFRLLTVVPAATYEAAITIARDMELTKGDKITLSTDLNEGPMQVLNVRAVPSAKRVIGAVANAISGGVPGGGATQGEALGSVDTEWTLQVIPQ